MISKLISLSVISFVIVAIVQMVNKASQAVYLQAERTMTVPYAKAQSLYDEANY